LRFERIAGQDYTTLARVGSGAHSIAGATETSWHPHSMPKSGLLRCSNPYISAVFMLITSSYLVGACTSPSFSP
jgi:hypothetical protein